MELDGDSEGEFEEDGLSEGELLGDSDGEFEGELLDDAPVAVVPS